MNDKKTKVFKSKINFGALILLAIGILLLLNNFNFVSWTIWEILFKFWPVLFIIWGIKALAGKDWLGNLLVTIIVVFILVFVITYSVSCVNKNFDNWLEKNIPVWSQIKKWLPQTTPRSRFFRFNPWDNPYQFKYR